jgi:hypothetical protein
MFRLPYYGSEHGIAPFLFSLRSLEAYGSDESPKLNDPVIYNFGNVLESDRPVGWWKNWRCSDYST